MLIGCACLGTLFVIPNWCGGDDRRYRSISEDLHDPSTGRCYFLVKRDIVFRKRRQVTEKERDEKGKIFSAKKCVIHCGNVSC